MVSGSDYVGARLVHMRQRVKDSRWESERVEGGQYLKAGMLIYKQKARVGP